MNTLSKSLLALTLTAATAAQAQPVFSCCSTEEHQHLARPDDHAPISVMGDHTHSKDGWMFSYRYMNMQMDGMRSGTDRVSSSDVFGANYAVAPESMTMEMHMLGAMYAPTDKLTLMLMANYIETEMDHLVNPAVAGMINGGESGFTTKSSGLGDLKVAALYRIYLEGNRKAHFTLGLSLPTGSIDEKDDTPAMGGRQRQQLPTSMQLGSGTVDLLPSLTFVQQLDDWSWGTQMNGVIRLQDENSNDYRLGHQFEWLSWAGYNLTDWLGLTSGLSYKYTGKLEGAQKDVNLMAPGMRQSVTTAFEDNFGGERIDIILGMNLLKPSGALAGHRLSLDVRLPLWQDLNGYQLETDSVLTLGWNMVF
ncbi:transporter [Coraliomargarita sp. W4R72]